MVIFKAVDVPVCLSGHERRGTVMISETKHSIVGMEFLLGSVLRFNADGSFDLYFPRESVNPQRCR